MFMFACAVASVELSAGTYRKKSASCVQIEKLLLLQFIEFIVL